jgi:hypothetical protein
MSPKETAVEVEYFIKMADTIPQLAQFPKDKFDALRNIYQTFGPEAVRL